MIRVENGLERKKMYTFSLEGCEGLPKRSENYKGH